MSGSVDVRGILRRTAAGLHSVAGDCKTDLGTPMRQAAEDVDKVLAVVLELIESANRARTILALHDDRCPQLDAALANVGSAS
jgi:hypothetical protein